MRAVKDDLGSFRRRASCSNELMPVLSSVEDPGRLADLIASNVTIKVQTGQALLEEMDPVERLRRVGALLQKEIEILEVQDDDPVARQRGDVQGAARIFPARAAAADPVGAGRRRQRQGELDQLRAQVEKARMPEEARAEADRQLRRLDQANPDSRGEVVRTFLEWLVEVPWQTTTADHLDLAAARKILDDDHYGLEDSRIASWSTSVS